MKIVLLNDSEQKIGGGWSFLRNLSKGLKSLGHQVVDNFLEANIAVVAGVTMVKRDTIKAVKEKGIKLIVRVDNVPRNSRNRNTGTSRLKDYTSWADEVIWQSKWAEDYLIDFVRKEGVIIYNGVDTEVFKPEGNKYLALTLKDCQPIYLYSRYNRDETKNWEMAWYKYQLIHRANPKAGLVIVGQFSPEQEQYSFDFFRGERYNYIGIVDDIEMMARVYRGSNYLMASYFNDCFSNTYLEFLMTKNPDIAEKVFYKPNLSGGTPEMFQLWNTKGREYFTLERMAKDYEQLFEKVLKM